MTQAEDPRKMRQARGVVAQRLRLHFRNLYAELDKDTAEFFQRVMQQAEMRNDIPPLPRGPMAPPRHSPV
jgi:hypothetical protein